MHNTHLRSAKVYLGEIRAILRFQFRCQLQQEACFVRSDFAFDGFGYNLDS